MSFPNTTTSGFPPSPKPPPTRLDPIEFDPNDNQTSPWATYIPRRTPSFKVHAKRGNATGAISNHGCGILYTWDSVANKWIEVFNWPNQSLGPPRNCDGCGQNMWVNFTNVNRYRTATGYNQGKTKWVKKGNDDFTSPVFACDSCR